ncbi:MAG: DUF937 domain-containing protein [Clostridiaceae bacterium]
MELIDMLLKGFGGNPQEQPQQNQHEQLRQEQEYQNLQQDMQNRQYQEQAPADGSLSGFDINELAGQLGVSPDKAQSILKMALPLILGKLGQNAETDDGAQSLSNALEQHTGRQYVKPQDIDEDDGKGILGHIFGNFGTDRVAGEIGKEAGVDKGMSMKILTMLAPLALAYLANKKKTQKLDDRGVRDLTKGYSDQLNQQSGGSLYDILKNIPNQQQPQEDPGMGGLLGGLLGGLFGK